MSTHAPSHDGSHDEHALDDGAVHAHISPTWFYVAIFLTLVVLTVLTVAQSYVDLGKLNLVFVILIASTKAGLVATFFMHLKYDNKFYTLIFISCIFFIGIFFTYTMNDTNNRGALDPDQNVKVLPKTGEDAPGGFSMPAPASSGAEGAEHGTGAGGGGSLGSGASPAQSGSPAGIAPEHH